MATYQTETLKELKSTLDKQIANRENNKSIQTWVRVEQMCRNYAEGAKE